MLVAMKRKTTKILATVTVEAVISISIVGFIYMHISVLNRIGFFDTFLTPLTSKLCDI